MIEFKHVSKTFHGKKIIDDISFQIPDGEFVVLLGESGCGKTTFTCGLLRALGD